MPYLYRPLYILIQLLQITISDTTIYLDKGESYILDNIYEPNSYKFQDPIHNDNLLRLLPHQINITQDHSHEIIHFQLGKNLQFLEIYILFKSKQEIAFKFYKFEHTDAINNVLQNRILEKQQYNLSSISRCLNFSEYKNQIYILCVDKFDQLQLTYIDVTNQTIINRYSDIIIQHNCSYDIGIQQQIFIFSCFGTANWQINQVILFNDSFQLQLKWNLISFSNYFQIQFDLENTQTILQGYKIFQEQLYLFSSRNIYEVQEYSATNIAISVSYAESDIIRVQDYSFLNPIFLTQENQEDILRNMNFIKMKDINTLNLLNQDKQKDFSIIYNRSLIIIDMFLFLQYINQQYKYMEIEQIEYFSQLSLVVIQSNNELRIFQIQYTHNLITIANNSLTMINQFSNDQIKFINPDSINSNLETQYLTHNMVKLGTSEVLIEIIDIPINFLQLKQSILNLQTQIQKMSIIVEILKKNEEFKQLLFIYQKEQLIYQYWFTCSNKVLKLLQFQQLKKGFEFIIQTNIDCRDIKQFHHQNRYYGENQLVFIQQNKLNEIIFIYQVNIQEQNVQQRSIFNISSYDIKILHNKLFDYFVVMLCGQNLIKINLHSSQIEQQSIQTIQYAKIYTIQYNFAIYYKKLSIYLDPLFHIVQSMHINVFQFDQTIYKEIQDLIVFDNKNIIVILLNIYNKIELLHYYLNEVNQFIFIKQLPIYQYQIIPTLVIKYLENSFISIEALFNQQRVILLFDISYNSFYCLRSVNEVISENYYINNLGYLYFIYNDTLQIICDQKILIQQNIETMNNSLTLNEILDIQLNQNNFHNNLIVHLKYYDFIIDLKLLKKELSIQLDQHYDLYPLDEKSLVKGTIDQIISKDFKIISPLQIQRTNLILKGEILKLYQNNIFQINHINQIKFYKILDKKDEYEIQLINQNQIDIPNINCIDIFPFFLDKQDYLLVICYKKGNSLQFSDFIFFIYQRIQDHLIFFQKFQSQKLDIISKWTLFQKYFVIICGYDLIVYEIQKIDNKLHFIKKCLMLPFNSIIYFQKQQIFIIQKHPDQTTIQQFDYETYSIRQLYTIKFNYKVLEDIHKILKLDAENFIVASISENTIEILQYFPSYQQLAILKIVETTQIYNFILRDLQINKQKQFIVEVASLDYPTQQHDIIIYNFKFGQKEKVYPTQHLYNFSLYYVQQQEKNNFIFLREIVKNNKMLAFADLYPQYYIKLDNINQNIVQGNILISNKLKRIQVSITINKQIKQRFQFEYLILIIIHFIVYHLIQKYKIVNEKYVIMHKYIQ